LSPSEIIYVFRGGETGVYALTTDPSGHILPTRLYPQIRWWLERRVTLQTDKILPKPEIAKTILTAIAENGFYLTHRAIDAELEFDDAPPSASPETG
jgi:hypothetical protein